MIWYTHTHICESHMFITLFANSLDYCTWHLTKPKSVMLIMICNVYFNSKSHHNVFLARRCITHTHLLDVKVWPNYDLLCHKRESRNTKIISFMDRKINRKLMASVRDNINSSVFIYYIFLFLITIILSLIVSNLVTCLTYLNSRYESRIVTHEKHGNET